MLAAGLGMTTFMPRRTLDDPEIAALAQCFTHNDGIRVLPDVIQYLNERAADETNWLETLSKSDVNTTVVWGVHDNVAPLRVPNHVWQTYLKAKARPKPLLGGAARGSLSSVRRPRAAGPDRPPHARGEDVALQTLGTSPTGPCWWTTAQ